MIKAEHSVLINRPLEEVFAFSVDPAREPEWQDGVVAAGYSPGSAPGVGAEVFETRKFMGFEMTSKLKITEYQPNKLFVGKVIEGPVKFEVREVFEAINGNTKISISIEAEPGGFFKLAEGLVEKQLESQLRADYDRAKKLLES